jgi:hypothetical protein
LIGPEPRATRPAQGEPLMQFFEPILHIPALAVARMSRPRLIVHKTPM